MRVCVCHVCVCVCACCSEAARDGASEPARGAEMGRAGRAAAKCDDLGRCRALAYGAGARRQPVHAHMYKVII